MCLHITTYLFKLLALFIIPNVALPIQPERFFLCSQAVEDALPQEESAQPLLNYDDILA
jgi:hypothetical protein